MVGPFANNFLIYAKYNKTSLVNIKEMILQILLINWPIFQFQLGYVLACKMGQVVILYPNIFTNNQGQLDLDLANIWNSGLERGILFSLFIPQWMETDHYKRMFRFTMLIPMVNIHY